MHKKITNGRKNPKPSHVLESIKYDDVFWTYSKQKQNRILKEIRKIAGLEAGCEITHLWRFKKGKTDPYYSPHNHLIAYGWLGNGKEIHDIVMKKYGINILYKKIATLHTRQDVFFVTNYLLSHVAVKNNKHSLRWFGELSYRKISISKLNHFKDQEFLDEDDSIEKSKSCEICQEKLYPAKINKDHSKWHELLPEPDDMDNDCLFADGLLSILDFMDERMIFYHDNYDGFHQKTKREIKEEQEARQKKTPLEYPS